MIIALVLFAVGFLFLGYTVGRIHEHKLKTPNNE